jgi:tetratricopeptide (TPR) repeat protein
VTPPPEPTATPAIPAADTDDDADSREWHVRRPPQANDAAEPAQDGDALAAMLDAAEDEAMLLEEDPAVAKARNEIGDRLRRRRCDEAASLLQRLATDVGGRAVAELALDAGDRCRALGKANAALSCYIAATRADPVFEGPLLRLADICLDDRDIDLAVSYLDRVARLHRMRGDARGAVRIYRKIATIAPYRDDILATLMRANATGQFED